MRSPFLRMLWGSRVRPPRPSTQERLALLAAWSSWDVKAAPIRCPVKEKRDA
jgi:hypothetical protein